MVIGNPSRSQRFSLIELLVVIAIISILASLLMPALQRAKAAAHQATCASHIKQVIVLKNLYSQDYHGYIPNIHYSANPMPADHHEYLWWWSKNNIGEYLFGSEEPDQLWYYQNHGLYSCPSRTIPEGTDAGTAHKGLPMTYGVNVAMWRQVGPDYGTEKRERLINLTRPSELISIGDTRQFIWGNVPQPYLSFQPNWDVGGGGDAGATTHLGNPAFADVYIPAITPGHQDGLPSTHPGVDFRHGWPRNRINAGMADGHVTAFRNGEVLYRHVQYNSELGY